MKKEISIPEGFEATIEGNKIILKKTESEDEKIRKTLKHYLEVRRCQTQSDEEYINCNNFLAWLEKQGQEPKKVSIWKHWKDGICGNGEGKLIYLIKNGDNYSLSSCLGYECDYILLSDLDNLMLEKQGTSYTKRDVDDAYVEGMVFAKNELEKQSEQKLPIEKLSEEMKTIGESLGFTTQEECDEYNQMVSDLIMCDDKGKQKKVERVEPKFKVGNWYQCTKDFFGKGVTFDKNTAYYCAKEGCLQDEYGCHIAIVKDLYDNFKLWTIQDAKDGDVLAYITDEEDLWIMIYWSLYEPYEGHVHYHALLVNDNFSDKGTCCICIDNLKPATKEQRDTLLKAMADAGYTFDFEKKELKEIEEKNLTDFENAMMHIGESFFGNNAGLDPNDTNAIKEQAKLLLELTNTYKWSKEDEQYLLVCKNALAKYQTTDKWDADIISCWLENKLKAPQNRWKPSDEQMAALDYYTHIYVDKLHGEALSKLIKDLKKLKGE